jgi:ubiquinone/menaquinone biosynthesis C-methylase UbiE
MGADRCCTQVIECTLPSLENHCLTLGGGIGWSTQEDLIIRVTEGCRGVERIKLMPFVRHRGTGKNAARTSFESMAKRWDVTWLEEKIDLARDLSTTEHWMWLKTYLTPPARVLEAGCGPGQLVYSLDKLGFDAYGIDFASDTVERAQKRWPHLHLTMGDLRAMAFEDGYFDGIVSFGAIEHEPEGPNAALNEMYRVLKPGGVLYCTVPCINLIHAMGLLTLEEWLITNRLIRRVTGRSAEVQFFEYVYRPKEYEDILQSVGFEVIEVAALSPHDSWRKLFCFRRVVDFLHRRDPFLTCHMIAGICRKPLNA